MLKILHSGLQPSFDLYTTGFSGVVSEDVKLPYIQGLKAGRLYGIDTNGKVKLANGDTLKPMGFIVVDAEGGFFENVPALASGKIAGTYGDAVIITDQIVVAETFAPGDAVYAGFGANAGLVTKTPESADSPSIGTAGSAASAAVPELKIYVKNN
jgi:hypothetical protein